MPSGTDVRSLFPGMQRRDATRESIRTTRLPSPARTPSTHAPRLVATALVRSSPTPLPSRPPIIPGTPFIAVGMMLDQTRRGRQLHVFLPPLLRLGGGDVAERLLPPHRPLAGGPAEPALAQCAEHLCAQPHARLHGPPLFFAWRARGRVRTAGRYGPRRAPRGGPIFSVTRGRFRSIHQRIRTVGTVPTARPGRPTAPPARHTGGSDAARHAPSSAPRPTRPVRS